MEVVDQIVIEVVEKSKSSFFKASGDIIVIGREEDCDIIITDNGASKKHVALEYKHGKWWALDLKSKNGTFINNQPISRVQIYLDDVIQVGEVYIRFASSKMSLAHCQRLRRPGKKYTHNKSITLIQNKKKAKEQLFDGTHHGMKEMTGIAAELDIAASKKDKILEKRKKKKKKL
ncbi:MAG: FHA domain-containing protein [Halobacteriovoraceae bacterium]|nr:FHA domain-containing protein [Halobacteriovoraceae bacterium]